MGYLISAHVSRTNPSPEALAQLPKSIGYRVYHHRAADVYLLDTFRPNRKSEYPFQSPLPTADIPLELPAELRALESVYSALSKLKLANSFKTSYINFALLLNRLTGSPVLSFVSDDDELDFACTVATGQLQRLKFRSADLLITYLDGAVHMQPLVTEEDDEEFLTDVERLKTLASGIPVAQRDIEWDPLLHAIAIEEWQKFSQQDSVILGLGSFDPPEDESEWVLLQSSATA